jgi:3-oxoacyl-(acyl-carrier-protein) synthase
MDSKEAKRMGRFNHFSLCAAQMALEDAHLTVTDDISTSTGVLIGSCFGGMITFYEQYQKFIEKGASRISPFFIPMLIKQHGSRTDKYKFNIKGPNYSRASACATGAHCIGESFRLSEKV